MSKYLFLPRPSLHLHPPWSRHLCAQRHGDGGCRFRARGPRGGRHRDLPGLCQVLRRHPKPARPRFERIGLVFDVTKRQDTPSPPPPLVGPPPVASLHQLITRTHHDKSAIPPPLGPRTRPRFEQPVQLGILVRLIHAYHLDAPDIQSRRVRRCKAESLDPIHRRRRILARDHTSSQCINFGGPYLYRPKARSSPSHYHQPPPPLEPQRLALALSYSRSE